MRAQAKRGSHHNQIKDARRGVDDELAAPRRADDAEHISRIYFGDRNRAFLAEKTARASRVTVTAPDRMSLT
jgi:hypothetical protein